MDYICTLFKNDPQFWDAIVFSGLGFFFRAYRVEKDNIHYSSKEAGYRTVMAIAIMMFLSLCINSEKTFFCERTNEIIQSIVVLIYCGIAFFQSVDNNNYDNNRLLSAVKFILIFLFAVGSNGCKLALSAAALFAGIYLARTGKIKEDIDIIIHTEIVLLCTETLVITIGVMLSLIKSNVASVIMMVLFTETVLYSINYTVVFVVKERLFFID